MTQEEYIKTHPEQFKDGIDEWLFLEFGILGGCCSAEKSHEYHIARMVAEKMIDKACDLYRKELRQMQNLLAMIRTDAADVLDIEGSVADFRKAMEE